MCIRSCTVMWNPSKITQQNGAKLKFHIHYTINSSINNCASATEVEKNTLENMNPVAIKQIPMNKWRDSKILRKISLTCVLNRTMDSAMNCDSIAMTPRIPCRRWLSVCQNSQHFTCRVTVVISCGALGPEQLVEILYVSFGRRRMSLRGISDARH